MAFWLINLETDIMLGFIPQYPKLSIVVAFIFWIINILTLIVQQSYIIDNGDKGIFSYETLISVLIVYGTLGLSQYLIVQKRIRDSSVQITPEEQLTPQKTGQLTMKSPLRTVITQNSHRKQPRLLPLATNFQKRYFKGLFLFITIFVIHSLLFIHQTTSLIILKAALSLHIILLTQLFSSVLINFFTIISIGNLLINLYSMNVFVKYFGSNTFYLAFMNFLTNTTEMYIVSLNLALIMASIVGLLFVNDLVSQILFYFYLSIFGVAFLIKIYQKIKANEY
ncbi:unnamed protein product (macronuclear) [Paramecium tetraurelia]|uniref:Uncharacterized protein n=1 Tax=Paramecium tetraurelia TaxID=5888 RepID=A0DMT4_PARTE|nr:uncharacterized protein GSPATT00018555001 [Paramecium tetraurelia]CAK84351.1 unnamed protein product [Paramecium tetraurelia]|eukprot:XP_001451748.1 hypothetical protein (macronuclear) [Paramecium tetraurelia strain d4-2]